MPELGAVTLTVRTRRLLADAYRSHGRHQRSAVRTSAAASSNSPITVQAVLNLPHVTLSTVATPAFPVRSTVRRRRNPAYRHWRLVRPDPHGFVRPADLLTLVAVPLPASGLSLTTQTYGGRCSPWRRCNNVPPHRGNQRADEYDHLLRAVRYRRTAQRGHQPPKHRHYR
jgi:hypothetical protein